MSALPKPIILRARQIFVRKKTLQRSILLHAALILLCGLAPLSGTLAITMDDAVAMAVRTNQSYLIARSQLEKADAEIQKATAGALPHLGFGSILTRNFKIPTLTYNGQSFKFGSDNQWDAGLSLTQPIWLGGKVFTALKIAKVYRLYTEDMVREAESEVTYGVRRSFLGAILAKDVVKVFADALMTADMNLDIVNKMYSQGVVSEYELLRARVEVANLRPQMTQAENRAVIALDNLKNLIGVKVSDSLELQYAFDSTMIGRQLNLVYLQGLAGANRASLRQQEHLQEITHRAIGIAKSGRSFNLIFQSQYGWRNQANDDSFQLFKKGSWAPSWSASLSFGIPIFDGFVTTAEIRKAKADNRAVELTYLQLKEQVELDVRQAYYNYQESGERLRAQLMTIEQAEEGLKIARLRYQNGIGTQLEILSAEAALTQARTNHVQASHDSAEAVYGLLRVTGVNTIDQLKEQ